MENIYPPQSFGSSEPVDLQGYFKTFNDVVKVENVKLVKQDDEEDNEDEYMLAIRDAMGVDGLDLGAIKALSLSTSTNLLTCEGENTSEYPMKVPPNLCSTTKFSQVYVENEKVKDLEVVNTRKEVTEHMSTWLQGNKRQFRNDLPSKGPPGDTPPDLTPGSDFILTILVYKPICFKFFNGRNTSERVRVSHEIVVLGSSTLFQLRDTIMCTADFGICKEVENTSVDLTPLSNAKKTYPSGFFFFENVFYNDFREPNAIDYSHPILTWARGKGINLASKTMQGVTFGQLKPRFGYPYLYMHQGNCEHLLVVSDARLLQPGDVLHSKAYPYVGKLYRTRNISCFMCGVSMARWIVLDCERLPQNKIFMCKVCCDSYNYIDGEKVGDFKLYPYYEKHVST